MIRLYFHEASAHQGEGVAMVLCHRRGLAGGLLCGLMTLSTAHASAVTPDGQRAAPSPRSQTMAAQQHSASVVRHDTKRSARQASQQPALPRIQPAGLQAIQGLADVLWQARTTNRTHPAALLVGAKKPVVTWVRARRQSRLPAQISHGVALSWRGAPVKSRRAISIQPRVTKAEQTIRSVAYKACTSPQALAALNGLDWDPSGTILPPGTKLQVPLRFRAASGFANAVRLRTGPGVRAERIHHTWGRPYVVRLLQDAFRAVHRRWPTRHPFIVHDVSRFGGGKLSSHKSPRAGRDIDIGYPTRDAERKDWGRPGLGAIDYARLWFVIDHLERTGFVAAIYMSPRIQRRLHAYASAQGEPPARLQVLFQYPCARGAKRTLIRHAKGHRDHMHIRFASPKDLPELKS